MYRIEVTEHRSKEYLRNLRTLPKEDQRVLINAIPSRPQNVVIPARDERDLREWAYRQRVIIKRISLLS